MSFKDEVKFKVEACGLNHSASWICSGRKKQPHPATPGALCPATPRVSSAPALRSRSNEETLLLRQTNNLSIILFCKMSSKDKIVIGKDYPTTS